MWEKGRPSRSPPPTERRSLCQSGSELMHKITRTWKKRLRVGHLGAPNIKAISSLTFNVQPAVWSKHEKRVWRIGLSMFQLGLQLHGRGCKMEMPLIVRLVSFARNTKEFGMAHKKINAFHACIFLGFRWFIGVVVTAIFILMSQPPITLLICMCSSSAKVMRWKKLKFCMGYIGTKDWVNGRKNVLKSDIWCIGWVDFDRPWKVRGCDGDTRERRVEGRLMESFERQPAVVVSGCYSRYGISEIIRYGGRLQEGMTSCVFNGILWLLSRSMKEHIGSVCFRRMARAGWEYRCF